MRILVTGAGGQLGQELQQIAKSHRDVQFFFYTKEQLDITDSSAIALVFKEVLPDYCINCAAYTLVDNAESERDLAFNINAEAVGYVARQCKSAGTKFIQISTDYVFDGTATEPYKEDAATNPLNIYGASKLEGERLAVKANGDTLIIRTSWVYSSYCANFVKTMLRLMPVKEEMGIVDDQYGCPTYAADLGQAILTIISSGKWIPGIYNYSNEESTTWYKFAVAIRQHCNFPCLLHPIATSQYPTPAKRPNYSVLDTGKIRETYGLAIRKWSDCLHECLDVLHCE